MFGGGLESLAYYTGSQLDVTGGVIFEANELSHFGNDGSADGQLFPFSPITIDHHYALIGEATYKGWQDWRLTLGARLQKNIGIIDSTDILPRFAAIYTINPKVRAKYVFNMSEVPPTLELWRGGNDPVTLPSGSKLSGATDTQKYKTHDPQLIYSSGKTQFTGTLFYVQAEDMIQFLQGSIATNNSKRWANMTDATTKGFQLEGKHKTGRFQFYGDYTFADAKFKDRFITVEGTTVDIVNNRAFASDEDLRIAGTPRHMWNLGADIDIKDNQFLNIHYRGYNDILTKCSTVPEYRNLGSGHFFDLNYLWRNAGLKGLDLSFYVTLPPELPPLWS